MNSYDDLLQIVGASKEKSRLYLELTVVAHVTAGLPPNIRSLQLTDERSRCESVGCKTLGVEHNPQLSRLAADNGSLGNIVQLLQRVFQFARNTAQLIGVIVLAPQRERHDGDVVDGASLYERLRNTGRNTIKIGVQLVVRLNERVFFFGPDVEAHDDHAQAGMTDRVDVFDSGNFAQQLLHRQANALSNFSRRCSRHLHKDVEHGNDDLRLLFTRRAEDGKSPEQQSSHNHQRCEFRIDETARDLSCETSSARIRSGLCAVGRFRLMIVSAHSWLLTRFDLLAAKFAAARVRDQNLPGLQSGQYLHFLCRGFAESDVAQPGDPVLIEHVNALQLSALDDRGARDKQRHPFSTYELGASKKTGSQRRVKRQFDFHEETATRRVCCRNDFDDFPFELSIPQSVDRDGHGLPLAHVPQVGFVHRGLQPVTA